MYYKYHKVHFKCGGSCIDSQQWIIKKKATINPKNKDDKGFQCAVIVEINCGETNQNLEKISNIKPFIALNNFYIKEKDICTA